MKPEIQVEINNHKNDIWTKIDTEYSRIFEITINLLKQNPTPMVQAISNQLYYLSTLIKNVANGSISTYDNPYNDKSKSDIFRIASSDGILKTMRINKSVASLGESCNYTQTALKNLYSDKTWTYFSFSGKSTMYDMLTIDEHSFLDYWEEIQRQLEKLDMVEEKVTLFHHYHSGEENIPVSFPNKVKDIQDDLKDVYTKIGDEFASSATQIVNKFPMDLNINSTSQIREMLGYSDYYTRANKINQIDFPSIVSNINKIKYDIHPVTLDIIDDLHGFNRILADVNLDFEQLISQLEKIDGSITGSVYIGKIIDTSRENYLKNGEIDITCIDEKSDYFGDGDFRDRAYLQMNIDLLYDAGIIIDDGQGRTDSIDDLYKYFNAEEFDIAKMDYFLEANVNNPENIGNLVDAISLLKSNLVKNNISIPLDVYEGLTKTQSICFQLLDFENLDEIKHVIINNDSFTVYYWNDFDIPTDEMMAPYRMPQTATEEDYRKQETWHFDQVTRNLTSGQISRYLLNSSKSYIDYHMNTESEMEILSTTIGNSTFGVIYSKIKSIIVNGSKKFSYAFIVMEISVVLFKEYNVKLEESQYWARQLVNHHYAVNAIDDGEVLDNITGLEYDTLFTVNSDANQSNLIPDMLPPMPVENASTLLQYEVFDNAYIISQGPNTPGYEKAMKWSYDLAKENGSDASYSTFSEFYAESMNTRYDSISKIKDLSLEEIIADYDKYADTLVAINAMILM